MTSSREPRGQGSGQGGPWGQTPGRNRPGCTGTGGGLHASVPVGHTEGQRTPSRFLKGGPTFNFALGTAGEIDNPDAWLTTEDQPGWPQSRPV